MHACAFARTSGPYRVSGIWATCALLPELLSGKSGSCDYNPRIILWHRKPDLAPNQHYLSKAVFCQLWRHQWCDEQPRREPKHVKLWLAPKRNATQPTAALLVQTAAWLPGDIPDPGCKAPSAGKAIWAHRIPPASGLGIPRTDVRGIPEQMF